ncbi:ketopantoate reductase family protein [Paenibacillus allorhizosphaerae]|uniref:2-dehydropantoate 2-reductase n=1 Tax=Paenibacillus allorhizosphaerae TaxID=2849866 RepID=A0ABM8VBS9_9BACL|nr:2-dehydropantoate 2-reductase [Paenibacillus allorhizosphaerae]CAG7620524.1 2-dehydropantoate 2-reductase [Paenibacillus allorhizosphaerae]
MGRVRLTVVGAGAVGLLFAAKLGMAGFRMELCARRPAQRQLLLENGVRFRSGIEESAKVNETIVRPHIRMLAEDASIAGESEERIHFIILAVKQAAFTPEFVEQVERLTGPASWVVCLQNGIGHIDALSRLVPEERIFAAVTTEGAMKRSDHEVIHTGNGTTWIGPVRPAGSREADEAQKKLAELLNLAGFHTFLSKNITSRVWQKLIINSAINPLTAILRVHNGELLQRPEAMELMRTLVDEAVATADKLGLSLDPDLWEQLLEVCRKTAGNRSSMLQDLLAGRMTEIDYITGGIMREAKKAGLVVPAHQTVYRLVKAIEAGAEAGGRTQLL